MSSSSHPHSNNPNIRPHSKKRTPRTYDLELFFYSENKKNKIEIMVILNGHNDENHQTKNKSIPLHDLLWWKKCL
jgi:hypothetical protein